MHLHMYGPNTVLEFGISFLSKKQFRKYKVLRCRLLSAQRDTKGACPAPSHPAPCPPPRLLLGSTDMGVGANLISAPRAVSPFHTLVVKFAASGALGKTDAQDGHTELQTGLEMVGQGSTTQLHRHQQKSSATCREVRDGQP